MPQHAIERCGCLQARRGYAAYASCCRTMYVVDVAQRCYRARKLLPPCSPCLRERADAHGLMLLSMLQNRERRIACPVVEVCYDDDSDVDMMLRPRGCVKVRGYACASRYAQRGEAVYVTLPLARRRYAAACRYLASMLARPCLLRSITTIDMMPGRCHYYAAFVSRFFTPCLPRQTCGFTSRCRATLIDD